MIPNVDLLKEFFFEAMRSGWATSSKKEPLPGLPGTKSIAFEKGDLKLLDYYFVATRSSVSYGTTVIWQSEVPRWVMHYGGFYEKRAIPILKAALQDAYSRNMFFGGRGPITFPDNVNNLCYHNNVGTSFLEFSRFHGFEYVFDPIGNRPLGEHRYFGGLLI